jgi:hypothetical protein
MSMNQFVELVEQNTHTNNFYMTANNAKQVNLACQNCSKILAISTIIQITTKFLIEVLFGLDLKGHLLLYIMI